MSGEPIVILGAGSTGEALVSAVRAYEPDTPITIVERELAGGECSYYACMPTKGMLRPPEAVAAARNVPGAAEAVTGLVDAERLFWHRDQITNGWDDSSQADWLESNGATLVRGEARIARPGVVAVGDQELPYGRLAVATGSSASIPPIPGLDGVEYWTNREATRTHEVPESIAIVGAGPVGCEFAQLFSRLGSRVAVVDVADRLLPSVDEEAGRMLADALEAEGVALHLGGGIAGVEPGITIALERRPPDRGAAAADRRRAASADRRAGPGAARRRDLEARRRGRRADARRARRVGDRGRHRHRHVHPRRQVPRADRRGRHGR